MKNKKLIVLIIVTLLIALIILTTMIKYSDFKKSENNINNVLNEVENTNEAEYTIDNITEENNNVAEDIDLENNEKIIQEGAIKDDDKIIKNQQENNTTAETQHSSTQQALPKPTPTQMPNPESKPTQQATIQQPTPEPTQMQQLPTQPTPTKCTNTNNHGMEVGNSNIWFETKAVAIEYYKTKIKYWGDLWENFEIDDETYYKNCPYRL